MPASIVTNEVVASQSMVVKFEDSIDGLLALLGKSDVTVLPEGNAFNVYKTSGTLVTEQVADGQQITASEYNTVLDHPVILTVKKYRKLTGIGKVQTLGFEKAVENTNDALLRDVRKTVKASLFNALSNGTGTAEGIGFQDAAAQAVAKLQVVAEDEDVTPILFCHPMDVADYLGKASVTVQSAYGMKYIEDFLGIGTMVVDPRVTEGEVWATAKENIEVVAAGVLDVEDAVLDKSGCMSCSTGYVRDCAAYETVVLSGATCELSFLDHCIKATIASA